MLKLKPRLRMFAPSRPYSRACSMALLSRLHRQRILGADVDDALGRAHRVSADDHALEQRMRVALDLVAVHVSAGVALVGVADDVLGVGLGLGQKIPFVAGEEARAAASAQPGGLDLLDYIVRAPVDQHFVEGLIAAHRDVLLDVRGVDEPAVAQHNLLLPLEERDRFQEGISG
jgi:hypothetical protein